MTTERQQEPPRRYPSMAVPRGHVQPAPRRVRGLLGGSVVFDTERALYVWEWPNYPQYYVPVADVAPECLVDERRAASSALGDAASHGLRGGDEHRSGAAVVFGNDATSALAGTVRFTWDALDAWFEEDEEIFVHPRNPYTRVDAIRSHRTVRVELAGVVLAESRSPVMLFETGLPTRYYLDKTDVRFEHLVASEASTVCPYKGRTTGYWSVATDGGRREDLVWCYDYPVAAVAAIAGRVAFYDEQVDVFVDGAAVPRPVTHFFGT